VPALRQVLVLVLVRVLVRVRVPVPSPAQTHRPEQERKRHHPSMLSIPVQSTVSCDRQIFSAPRRQHPR
jgi:hypothetical protein